MTTYYMQVGQREAADYAGVNSKATPTSEHEYNFTILGRNSISAPTTSHLYINTDIYLFYTLPPPLLHFYRISFFQL